MLERCAPGWTKETTVHHYRVMWKGKTYHSLPRGEHGKKQGQTTVETGHIKHLIRQLKIDMECAKKHLAVLR
jgi:hypothetical protein